MGHSRQENYLQPQPASDARHRLVFETKPGPESWLSFDSQFAKELFEMKMPSEENLIDRILTLRVKSQHKQTDW